MNEAKNELTSAAMERISALVDGRLRGEACTQAVDDLLSDPQSVQLWHAYHVVGDVLRSSDLASTSDEHAFLARLQKRLTLEPARPGLVGAEAAPSATHLTRLVSVDTNKPGANASVFRWKMLAGLACTALFGLVGVTLWNQTGMHGVAQMAALNPAAPATPTVHTANSAMGPMLRDARLDELMAAHRQLGGHSALQVPAGFLRNATHEGSGR